MKVDLEKLIEAVEASKTKIEASNCGDGCCATYVSVVDADELVRLLREMKES